MKKARIALLATAMSLTTIVVSAQSRSVLRERISSWGSCRNVAITKNNGDLAISTTSNFVQSDCPRGLVRALESLRADGKYIDDVTLTESGEWLILYGKNSCIWSSIPNDLERQIRRYQADDETINSVTFNDSGDYVVVTNDRIATSSTTLMDWLKEGEDEYGELWTVFLNDDGVVAVYESGYYYRGDVPRALKDALNDSSLDCYRVKFAGRSYFFADKDGEYDYNM